MHAKATSSAKLTKEEEEEKAKAGVWDHGRDMGLGGRLMDEGKRKQIVNDAKGLSSRFGHGKSGGYL